jgi:hypothetical protein
MRLFELAYTCRLFGELVGVDSATSELESVTRGCIDLDDEAHAKALLVWLNRWGCRQFAIAHHGEASRMLAEWGDLWLPLLPKPSGSLSQLKVRQLEVTADAYADAKDRQASRRVLKDGRSSSVTVGATGAAKILHAVRPRVLPPWDDPMRVALGLDGDRDGYLRYLLDVQAHCRNIEAEAASFGIAARDIPAALGRPASSLPKMIDEHYWITLTRGHVPPTGEDLSRWAAWASVAPPSLP